MTEPTELAERFEDDRARLRSVAFRMLGSQDEAEDAVQEAWLRLSRADASGIDDLKAWLTTVVARVCLDVLRSRKSRGEESLDTKTVELGARAGDAPDPEREALLADSIGVALLVVLDTLTPAERVAFVLHDMFDLPFEEIAPIVGRSAVATRQLASRARRRVRGGASAAEADRAAGREVVDAFLAAARNGDFATLISLLDPDVVLRADPIAVKSGAFAEVRGADAVARIASREHAAQPALVDGGPGLVLQFGGHAQRAFAFVIVDGKIAEIEVIADAKRLRVPDVVVLR